MVGDLIEISRRLEAQFTRVVESQDYLDLLRSQNQVSVMLQPQASTSCKKSDHSSRSSQNTPYISQWGLKHPILAVVISFTSLTAVFSPNYRNEWFEPFLCRGARRDKRQRPTLKQPPDTLRAPTRKDPPPSSLT